MSSALTRKNKMRPPAGMYDNRDGGARRVSSVPSAPGGRRRGKCKFFDCERGIRDGLSVDIPEDPNQYPFYPPAPPPGYYGQQPGSPGFHNRSFDNPPGGLGRQMVIQHPKVLKDGSAELPSACHNWLRRRNQRDDSSEHAALIPPRYHRQHGNTFADADVANMGDRDRHTIAPYRLDEKPLSENCPQQEFLLHRIAYGNSKLAHISNMEYSNPPWDPIAIQLFLLRIQDVERYNTIMGQIQALILSIGSCEEITAFILPQQLPYSSALPNFDSTSPPPSAPEQFLASEGNSLNFVDHPFLEEPGCPTFSVPSNTFSTPTRPSAPDQLLVAEDTNTGFVAHEWLTVSTSSTSTSTSTSIPPDTSIQPLIPDDQTFNLVDRNSEEHSSFPLEIFSQKIRAFPREPGCIHLQRGMDLYLEREVSRITRITENQYQDSNPNHIFLRAHIYPTVLFRGDKVYPWSRGNYVALGSTVSSLLMPQAVDVGGASCGFEKGT
ncbi:hypothetical protein BT69DRAFT_1401103 [Atractiella rhizophila]|nr:hypothetical protein BT69DRAFT_1401103 [Atractiella rhizophila]